MARERTFSIVKPDAVEKGHLGEILALFERNGLKVVATRMIWLSRAKAKEFYAVHKERPFFEDLVSYMVSGPVVVSCLEGENAILKHREVLGATDPADAAEGTVRKMFGESIERNAAHGSDGHDTAKVEVAHFFAGVDLFNYERV